MNIYTSFNQKKSISFTAWNANIIFLITIVLSMSNPAKAQVLYGVTGKGGGTIAKYDVPTNTLTDVFVYEVPGRNNGYLVEASNGKIYGTTREGGNFGEGTIYSLDAVTYRYTKLKDFEITTGAYPEGGLAEGADKKIVWYYLVWGSHGCRHNFFPRSRFVHVYNGEKFYFH